MSAPITELGRRPQLYVPLKELGPVLAKHFGVGPGTYNVVVEFEFAVTALGPNSDDLAPGVATRISGMGIEPTTVRGPLTFDFAAPAPDAQAEQK